MGAMILISIEQGFIFSLLAIGVMLTFRILDIADLSVEGTFPLGAFVFAKFAHIFLPPVSMVLSFFAGCLAGYFTYFLYKKVKIAPILAGILTMTILYTVNLRLTGQSNVPLMDAPSMFDFFSGTWGKLISLAFIALIIKLALDWFFKTEKGYLLLATGDNEDLVKSLGQKPDKFYCLGLVLSNGLAALAGCLAAQYQGYVDISMGQSMIVTALASLIIGETSFQKLPIRGTSRCILGAIVYRIIYGLALYMGLTPDDLKAITGLLVIIFIAYNNLSKQVLKKGVKAC